VDCPALAEPVAVDPAMWEQIVLNLLSNAFKYTFEGEICVALRHRDHGVELTVADTGTGIPAAELPRIFERFHRVEDARGRSHEGSGIGLALVNELVKLHGGRIDVSSEVGRGTTFRVTIPIRQELAVAPAVAPAVAGPEAFLAEIAQWSRDEDAPAPEDAPPVPRPSSARVLVVDDNGDMRAYLAQLLSTRWQVETASDGAHALAAVQADPPDLVLSDVMMPVMDGLALLRALREGERTRTIPVILLSARAGEEATVQGLAGGADDYLVKPFTAGELLARVGAQLAVSELREEALRKGREHAREAERLLAEARAATRSRDDMLGTVSHDLRNPLNAIRLATGLLELAAPPGEEGAAVRRASGRIDRSVSTMERLIRDLLDVTSIESRKLTLDRRPLDLARLLADLQETFSAAAHEKDVALAFEVPFDLPGIAADRHRILQALSNLVENALKFTPGGGRVVVSARHEGSCLALAVADTGVGIAPSAIDHVFDRFWHSGQRGRSGHGLGLAIASGIAEAHGGTIRATSEPGRGSTFTLSLPVAP
jgi:signal transduction histidine kinase